MKFQHSMIATLLAATCMATVARGVVAEEKPAAEPSAAAEFVAAFRDTEARGRLHTVAAKLEQKLNQPGEEADRIARELLAVKSEVVADKRIAKLLDDLAQRKKAALAAKLLVQIAFARGRTMGHDHARVVVGQLVIDDGKADPTMVMAQMPILDEGFFAGEAGDSKRPVCFRSHGYHDLDVKLPEGEPGDVTYLGQVTLRPVTTDQQASLKGTIKLDGSSNPESAKVALKIAMGPVNTPSNGYSGRARWPKGIKALVSTGGEFSAQGLNPSEYDIHISAAGHVDLVKRVKFPSAKPLDIGDCRLLNSDLGFYIGSTAPKTPELAWEKDYAAAEKRARTEKKPLLVMMTATWCGPCKLLEKETLNDAWIRHFLSSFVLVQAYEDKEVEKLYGLAGYPTLAFIDSSGKLAHKSVGYKPAIHFSTECARALKALSLEFPPELKTLIENKIVVLD